MKRYKKKLDTVNGLNLKDKRFSLLPSNEKAVPIIYWNGFKYHLCDFTLDDEKPDPIL
jgi:hypothetical protein